MSTRLVFRTPSDLSVGRVLLRGPNGQQTEWVATAGEPARDLHDVMPGVYTAMIAPLGGRPRPFFFEVRPDVQNTVEAPPFAALASGHAEVAFLGLSDERIAEVVPPQLIPELSPGPLERSRVPDTAWTQISALPADKARTFSIGLSRDTRPAQVGGWRPYKGPRPDVTFEDNGVSLVFTVSHRRWRRPRLRLSTSLEGVRVERLMVPLFEGGTIVAFRPSSVSTLDIALRVVPKDPQTRAMVQALQAGTIEEAAAVKDQILRQADFREIVEQDPWAAMVMALLTIRFPMVFGPKGPTWGPLLADRYGWASDSHVVLARHHLASAGETKEEQLGAARDALAALQKARSLGAPYFSYSNQLLGELLGGLAALDDLDPDLGRQAKKAHDRWQADGQLLRSAGASFVWQMKERRASFSNESELFVRTKGGLDERYAAVLLRGKVGREGLTVQAASKPPEAPSPEIRRQVRAMKMARSIDQFLAPIEVRVSRPLEAPGLRRRIRHPADPQKGRFGGQATRGGYALCAEFRQTARNWVETTLRVRADETIEPSFTDTVEFYLHDTFNPNVLKSTFRGREATLSVQSWGGFTVGAWLPRARIELECDLSELPEAPRIIRER